jgi:hypothetical protein
MDLPLPQKTCYHLSSTFKGYCVADVCVSFKASNGSLRAAQKQVGNEIMLKLKPNCECCNKDLPPEAADARICSYECTFCAECAEARLPGGKCPNCGGELAKRPVRPANMLAKHPASSERVTKEHAFCS